MDQTASFRRELITDSDGIMGENSTIGEILDLRSELLVFTATKNVEYDRKYKLCLFLFLFYMFHNDWGDH